MNNNTIFHKYIIYIIIYVAILCNNVYAKEIESYSYIISEKEKVVLEQLCNEHIVAVAKVMGYEEEVNNMSPIIFLGKKGKNQVGEKEYITGNIYFSKVAEKKHLASIVFHRKTKTIVEMYYNTDNIYFSLAGKKNYNKTGTTDGSGWHKYETPKGDVDYYLIYNNATKYGKYVGINREDGWSIEGSNTMGASNVFTFYWKYYNNHGAEYSEGHARISLNYKGWPKYFERGIKQEKYNDLPNINPRDAIKIAKKTIRKYRKGCYYPGKTRIVIKSPFAYKTSGWCKVNDRDNNSDSLVYEIHFYDCKMENINIDHDNIKGIEYLRTTAIIVVDAMTGEIIYVHEMLLGQCDG